MAIFHSRKFWITVSDAVTSILTMAVTLAFAKDLETRGFVLGVIAALQPVVISLINGIATEDAALTAANAVRDAAVTTVSAPAVPNPVEAAQA
jgi:hypothetical protein